MQESSPPALDTPVQPAQQSGLKRGGRKPGPWKKRPKQPPITYDKEQSAKILGVSVRQLDQYIDSGELAASRLNQKSVRILRENLLAFFESRQINKAPREAGGR